MENTIEATFTVIEETSPSPEPTPEELAALEAEKQAELEKQRKAAEVSAQDIVMLIDKYLSDKAALRDEDDCINIFNNSIHRWDFKNIPAPTMEQLHSLIEPMKTAEAANKSNEEALKFLNETDHKVLRHIGQQTLGLATSLTAQEYFELEQQRQQAREAIVK